MGFTTTTIIRVLQLLSIGATIIPSGSNVVLAEDVTTFDPAGEVSSAHHGLRFKRQTSPQDGQPVPAKFYPVIGHGSGVCYQRLKIERMQSQFPDIWNMFILALENFMSATETSDYSWFMVAGIHGAPKIPWQQAPIDSVPAGHYDTTRGYCTHSSALFSTWHRPYSVLLEQMLVSKARQIAATFPVGATRDRYTAAAAQVRLPYWDWSDPTTQSYLPAVTMQQTISVVKPAGSVSIANPLFAYRFKSSTLRNQYFTGNFRTWDSTRRQPDSSGVSRNSLASSTMQQGFSSRRSQTYSALTRTSYNSFNDACEGVHNGIHTNIGGNGHMTFLDVSAFDPIFVLHHTNVDRLYAIWQAAHPGVYMSPSTATRTFSRPVNPSNTNERDDLNTPLFPFRKTSGIFWTSQDVRDARSIWVNGYGYDEVPCSYRSGRTTAQIRDFAVSRMNALYAPTSVVGFTSENAPIPPEEQKQTGKTTRLVKTRKEYTLKFALDHAEIPGSWSFHTFNGPPPADASTWSLSPKLIGSVSDLGAPAADGTFGAPASPPMKKDNELFAKEIGLTEPAISRKMIPTEAAYEKAEQWFTTNLYWGIEREGKSISLEDLETLEVGVYECEVTYGAEGDSTMLPQRGEPKLVTKITKGKPKGVESQDALDSVVLLDGTEVPVPKFV